MKIARPKRHQTREQTWEYQTNLETLHLAKKPNKNAKSAKRKHSHCITTAFAETALTLMLKEPKKIKNHTYATNYEEVRARQLETLKNKRRENGVMQRFIDIPIPELKIMIKSGKSMAECARHFDVSPQVIANRCSYYGLRKKRSRKK